MKNVKIVVGANFGDEGKGLMSRYFSINKSNPVNILYNGSAQRGHTVDLKSGKRHVFHNFGAAFLDDVPTYYSKYFMAHPMDFVREYEEISDFKKSFPPVLVDPECLIVLPFDMAITRIYEKYLSDTTGTEYGSCGYGNWECLERNKKSSIKITYDYLWGKTDWEIVKILKEQYLDYFNQRLSSLGVKYIPKDYSQWSSWDWDEIGLFIEHFVEDLRFFYSHTLWWDFDSIYKSFDNFIFEGAQGLYLNKDNEKFQPWVTSTNTGVKNPLKIIGERDFDSKEVCYVTRTYLTKHGDGIFPGECEKESINPDMFDKTNIPNPWQGTLRYGKVDNNEILKEIDKDFSLCGNSFEKTIAITHTNEYFPENFILGNYYSNTPYSEDITKRSD